MTPPSGSPIRWGVVAVVKGIKSIVGTVVVLAVLLAVWQASGRSPETVTHNAMALLQRGADMVRSIWAWITGG